MAKLDEPLQRLATGRQQRRATPAEWHEALLWAATRTLRQGALAAVDSDWQLGGAGRDENDPAPRDTMSRCACGEPTFPPGRGWGLGGRTRRRP